MDDISRLLHEARPLYFARKRRKTTLKALSGIACILIAGVLSTRPFSGNADLGFSLYDTVSYNEAFDYQTSVIKDMGLPTDDFGLLMVL